MAAFTLDASGNILAEVPVSAKTANPRVHFGFDDAGEYDIERQLDERINGVAITAKQPRLHPVL
jgi:hypothetical protein